MHMQYTGCFVGIPPWLGHCGFLAVPNLEPPAAAIAVVFNGNMHASAEAQDDMTLRENATMKQHPTASTLAVIQQLLSAPPSL